MNQFQCFGEYNSMYCNCAKQSKNGRCRTSCNSNNNKKPIITIIVKELHKESIKLYNENNNQVC